jgi:Xaa-Pro aminopeptidase
MDKNKEYLILPERQAWQDVYEGKIYEDSIREISGITTILSATDGWKSLRTRLKKVKHVATLSPPPNYVKSHSFYTNPARTNLISRITSINSDIKLLDLGEHMMRLRIIKQPQEIEAIKRAINITISALKEITKPKNLKKYLHEYELEADITKGFRFRGANGNAFNPVIASGSNSTIIHYMSNSGPMVKNGFTVVDVGADVSHYAADISRTVTVSKPTSRQRKIFNAVKAVQDFGISQLKPGVVLNDYEIQVEHYMGEKLRELGLIKSISKEVVRTYYPHRTSHFLGLDVHDVGDYKKPLEPNMVLTCEPGIYIPKEGLGVRIEDDLLITDYGNAMLSNALSRDLD